jgi:hypothetical protein
MGAIVKLLLMGVLLIPITLLLIDKRQISSPISSRPRSLSCQGEVKEGIFVSREQLAEFLTIPERDTRVRVQDVLKQPYCQLSSIEVRAGVPSERVIYPLAFDPQIWLVILYEGEEYAGYKFQIQ